MRVLLLLTLSWVIGLTAPLFSLIGHEISGRDLILILGGLFLLAKSTYEIHDRLEGESGHASARVAASFAAVVAQIVVLDAVFSLDSVITAVGMVDQLGVMIAAVIVSVAIMLVSAGAISAFVNRHPTIKMLALSFLLLIGLTLLLGRLRPAHPQGIHLLRDGLLAPRGAAEPAGSCPRPARRAGAAPSAVRGRYLRATCEVGAVG
jgi:predicted tellurium resistance membrane protein TerC